MITAADEPTICTEDDIKEYIQSNIPGISAEDYWKIRCEYIYKNKPLCQCVSEYKSRRLVDEWNRSKDKKYYKVDMLNGGTKFVFMCEDMVKSLYPGRWEEVK